MKKEKKKGSCLKTLLIVFGVFIVIGIIGNLAGGNAEDTSTINTPNNSASESIDDSQEDTLNTSALSSDNDAASGESSYKDEILEEETHSEESTESSEENQSENETDLPFIEEYDNEIVVSSKMILERFISGYKIPLAPQLWTIANFDENGAIIAITNITDDTTDQSQTAMVVLTPIMDGDQMTGSTPHYVSVGDTVYGDDGYCDEFFSNVEEILNAF